MMLINGDLIRVPQGTVIMEMSENPVPIQVASKPCVGIVIDNNPAAEDLVKVLLDEQVFLVAKRVIQLVDAQCL